LLLGLSHLHNREEDAANDDDCAEDLRNVGKS